MESLNILSQNEITLIFKDQIKKRMAQKYNWKREPVHILEKIQRKFFILMSQKTRSNIMKSKSPYLKNSRYELGNEVSDALEKYVFLLHERKVILHTLIVLGSRVKGRARPDSDIDVMVIASNLPGRSSTQLTNLPEKILNYKRRRVLSDHPILMGIQASSCCSREEFHSWLINFKLAAYDAIYYGNIIYDDGFWEYVNREYKWIRKNQSFDEKKIKKMLFYL